MFETQWPVTYSNKQGDKLTTWSGREIVLRRPQCRRSEAPKSVLTRGRVYLGLSECRQGLGLPFRRERTVRERRPGHPLVRRRLRVASSRFTRRTCATWHSGAAIDESTLIRRKDLTTGRKWKARNRKKGIERNSFRHSLATNSVEGRTKRGPCHPTSQFSTRTPPGRDRGPHPRPSALGLLALRLRFSPQPLTTLRHFPRPRC
jgi:hypothetical protein